jgi:hypothetical protein
MAIITHTYIVHTYTYIYVCMYVNFYIWRIKCVHFKLQSVASFGSCKRYLLRVRVFQFQYYWGLSTFHIGWPGSCINSRQDFCLHKNLLMNYWLQYEPIVRMKRRTRHFFHVSLDCIFCWSIFFERSVNRNVYSNKKKLFKSHETLWFTKYF